MTLRQNVEYSLIQHRWFSILRKSSRHRGPRDETDGEPDAGNPHVRFDRGMGNGAVDLLLESVMQQRIVVVQIGARHNYMLPIVLDDLGLLQAFYTDMCAGRGLGRALGLSKFPFLPLPQSLRSMWNRRLPDSVLRKTITFDLAALTYQLKLRSCRTEEDRFKASLEFDDAIGSEMTKAGFKGATHIYSVFGASSPYLFAARRCGIRIMTDVIIALSAEAIVLAEHKKFPDWGERPLDQRSLMGPDFKMACSILECTDLFICPSEFVQADLVDNWGVDREKTTVIPYSVGPAWHRTVTKATPEPGRILFAGTADLRKGIHYLAMAAEMLRSRGRHYKFRVAGQVDSSVRTKPICRTLDFLGRIPRSEIRNEFQCADIFVLPSLAEGSATVTYEALASGIPVVTTAAAGSVVRDGVDGFIVEERNAEALAWSIERLVQDRELRTKMSSSAELRAKEFSWQSYGERFVKSLKTFDARYVRQDSKSGECI
jgi:glycosyltransferase involved in cell wall biosynthesis